MNNLKHDKPSNSIMFFSQPPKKNTYSHEKTYFFPKHPQKILFIFSKNVFLWHQKIINHEY